MYSRLKGNLIVLERFEWVCFNHSSWYTIKISIYDNSHLLLYIKYLVELITVLV